MSHFFVYPAQNESSISISWKDYSNTIDRTVVAVSRIDLNSLGILFTTPYDSNRCSSIDIRRRRSFRFNAKWWQAVQKTIDCEDREIDSIAAWIAAGDDIVIAQYVFVNTENHDEQPLLVLQARRVEPEEEQLAESPVLVENAYQINAAAFDAEHIYAVEEDVIIHDFGDEHQVSEIVVNFDELVDPAEQTIRFDPEMLSEGEPELLPAKALPINDGGDSNISSQVATAFAALGEGRWKDAADEFRSVCNALPGSPEALNDFGLSLLQLAIQVHENNPTATPAEEPHFEAAVLALRQAAQQDKHNPTILYNLATCLSTCGRHGVADRIWDATISLSPDDAASINGKAVSLIALDEFDAAATLLMRARELAPTEAVILRNLRRLRPTE